MGKEQIIKLIASVLLSLVIWHQSSTALFIHSHNTGNNTIVHSHPFSERTGGQSHSHSTTQFITIALLSSIAVTLGLSVFIAALSITATTLYRTYSQYFVLHWTLLSPSLRGPPAI